MSASKKSNKKTSADKTQGKKLKYAFLLLLLGNLILFSFLVYFLYKINTNFSTSFAENESQLASIPVMKEQSNIEVSARSFVVYDPLTRTIVSSKNPDLRLSPASSIKILTALVALDHYDLNEYLTIETTVTWRESRMGLYLGEEISFRNLLYGLLMISGNDAAKNLAQKYPGGTVSFVEKMNEKAKDIGLSESNFLDPSGFLDNNYSTAFELALLGANAMENETIREIVRTQKLVVYDKYGFTAHPLVNLNELLVMDGVVGVKTGFTNEAGGVLITNYVHEGRELIIVVMKSEDRFLDTRKIINAIDENVSYSDVSLID